MKLKEIGLAVLPLLILTLNSCSKIDDDIIYAPLNTSEIDLKGKYIKNEPSNPTDNELKVFGHIETKATLVPIWLEGDMVCIFSLDENNTILYKDTCTVYNINRDIAKITAEVAKNSYKYFASYPYNHISGEIGEVLNTEQEGYINHSGKFGDESVMTSYCPKDKNTFVFDSRYSLFKVTGFSSDNYPLTISFYREDGSTITRTYPKYNDETLYSSIWYKEFTSPMFTIEYKDGINTKTIQYPNTTIKPEHIYNYDFKKNYTNLVIFEGLLGELNFKPEHWVELPRSLTLQRGDKIHICYIAEDNSTWDVRCGTNSGTVFVSGNPNGGDPIEGEFIIGYKNPMLLKDYNKLYFWGQKSWITKVYITRD